MAWVVLIVAGVFETVWAGALAQPDWWRRPLPLAAFVIGSALLSLSAFWQPMRRAVVTALSPSLRRRLPPHRLA